MSFQKTKLFFITSVLFLAVAVLIPVSKTCAADSLSYESPQYYEVDVSSVNLSPTISSGEYTFSISPSLPSGLVINSSTGVISGIPYVYSPETTYTITASGSGEPLTFNLRMATLFRPESFSYEHGTSTLFFTINRQVSPAIQLIEQQVGVTYSISPSLPGGLSISSTTGEISGFATELSSLTTYTVTAENPLGSATSTLFAAVPMPWVQLGGDINASSATQSDFKFDINGIAYVVYNDASLGGGVVLKYDRINKTWNQLGYSTLFYGVAEKYKIIFDKNNNLLVSYVLGKKIFIKKYNPNTSQWVSLSSVHENIYNPTEETGSSISNTAVSHDMVTDSGSSIYESYVNEDGTLGISKFISNNVSGDGFIENLDDPQTLENFSYNKTNVVYGTTSGIDPLYPTITGKPLYFFSNPVLPDGLSFQENGMITGMPTVATPETVYTITAVNEVSTATTTITIATVGSWANISSDINYYEYFSFSSVLITDDSNNYYASYGLDNPNKDNYSNSIIKKYNYSSSSWEDILNGGENMEDYDNDIYSYHDVARAMAVKGDELYVLFLDAFSDESGESTDQNYATLSLKKYNLTSHSWENLSQMSFNESIWDLPKYKLAFSGNDLFLVAISYYGDTDVKRFDFEQKNFYSVGTFLSSHSGYPYDEKVSAVDNNYLYLGYSTLVGGAKVVIRRLDKAKLLDGQTEFWDNYSTDVSGVVNGLHVNDLTLDKNGVPYISYSYNNGTTNAYSVIKKFSTSTSEFVLVNEETDSYGSNLVDYISFDNDNNLSSIFISDDKNIRKYVGGVWTEITDEKLYVSWSYGKRLFFNSDNSFSVFFEGYGFKILNYEDGVTIPINTDYSIPPTISYHKNVLNYVVGKRIDPVFFDIGGGSVDNSTWLCPDLGPNSWNCQLPLGLRRAVNDSLVGTPLVAGTINLIFYVDNDAGSSTFPLTINIIDPWIPLSGSFSTSSKEVDTDVDRDNNFYVAYSEFSELDSSAGLFVKKYSEDVWTNLGENVSSAGQDVFNPKIVVGYGNIYVAYVDKNSNNLFVKKYNSADDTWVQLGAAVSSSYSDYFNLDYNSTDEEPFIVFYDSVLGKSIIKKFHNDYWELVGSYVDGKFPTLLYKNYGNEGIYVTTSSAAGVVKVENYKEINYSADGKEVPLADIRELVVNGDASPYNGGTATSTEAVRFNQKLKIIPFAGASISIPSLTVMTASSTFSMTALIASSTVDLYHASINNFTPAGTLMFGLPDLGLTLSSPITISIPTPSVSEGKQLEVYSKTAGGSWTKMTTCYVIAGKCSFQTSHLSEFAAGTVVVPSAGGGGGYVEPVIPTCASVTYSDFSTVCSGGFFTRSVLTSLPSGCTLSAAQLEATKQACTLLPIEEQPNPEEPSATSTATSTSATSTDNIIVKISKEVKEAFITLEKKLLQKINKLLTKRLLGRILLQVESHGEAWYLDPISSARYYLADGDNAYLALRQFGLGIKDTDIAKIPVGTYSYKGDIDTDKDGLSDKIEGGLGTNPNKADTDGDGTKDGDEVLKKNTNPLNKQKLSYSKSLANKLKGRIVIQTEKRGEAWYINPSDGKRYYLADGQMAYQVMRFLSLGITNNNIRQIMIGELK